MKGSRLRRNAARGSGLAALASVVVLTAVPGLAAGFAGAAGLALAAGDTPETAGTPVGDGSVSAVECVETTVTAPVVADTWLDENSPSSAKGSDSVLSVDAGSVNVDTGVASGRARALFRFAMPDAVPPGCVVESARLFVFSSEEDVGTRVEAVRLASAWSEASTSWSDQPETTGAASRTWSREGYMRWSVTEQVQAMLDSGSGHGFLLRDAAEGAETGGGGHGFYSREKGDGGTEPELVIHFAAPGSGEPPGPPLPPVPAAVSCGQVVTQSTLVTNDLSGCLGDGLVIAAPRIIVDLGGHTIDGTGLGSGILNDGHELVTVRNGTVQDFDYGVELAPETTANLVENLTLRLNQIAAVELFDVSATEVRGNRLDGNGGGILFVSGTRDSVAADNVITGNGG
ncbi:MAG TPA: DNRLRE domain-containing protein, partial [Gaiellaceae bacterium]